MPLRVRLYDLDLCGQVSCATLLRYFEETAMQASSQLGFDLEWYNARGQFWVIRSMLLERSGPARYQDDLEVRTWVSSMTRVRADRNYVLRRSKDSRILARATANWVYLNGRTMHPARIPPDIVAMFSNPEPAPFPSHPPLNHWIGLESPIHAQTVRRAWHYEADSAKHTNNAIYVDWLEEAVRESVLAHGLSLKLESGPSLWFYRHSLEYLTPARPGDELQITTDLTGQGKSAGYWRQEVHRKPSGELVARGESVTIWIDRESRSVSWRKVREASATLSSPRIIRNGV
jgi:acyl-CoA thioester hydrolase